MTVSFQLFSGPAELKPIGAHAPILSTAPNICTVLVHMKAEFLQPYRLLTRFENLFYYFIGSF